MPPDRVRVPELDGIRGIAIFLVLVWHYVVCQVGSPPPLFAFLKQTWSGVDLFFVLSGFLIGGILLDHRESNSYFSTFYGRRVCRILPIYFAWLALFVAFRAAQDELPLGTAREWLFGDALPLLSYATFTQNFVQAFEGTWGANWLAITWSLAIEEQFYLLLPIVIRFIPARILPWALIPFIVIAPFARVALYDPATEGIASYVLLICKTDALLLGVLCAWFVRQPSGEAAVRKAAPLLRILVFSFIGFACLAAYVPETVVTRVLPDSLLAIAYASLILLAVYLPESPFGKLARVRWLRKLGILAYGTYLFHQAVIGLVFGFARKRWPYISSAGDLLLIALSLLITIVLAAVSWRYFERPIVDYGRRRWDYLPRNPER
jgi:peptidoglycan/LPS O-acetylase OafA/YrhL